MSLTDRFFYALGAPVVNIGRQAAELYSIAIRTAIGIVRLRFRTREVFRQAYLIGNRSLLFITVTLGFLGLITVYQTALQIQQILPDFSMLGAAFLQLLTREFGPTIAGLMIAQ